MLVRCGVGGVSAASAAGCKYRNTSAFHMHEINRVKNAISIAPITRLPFRSKRTLEADNDNDDGDGDGEGDGGEEVEELRSEERVKLAIIGKMD